MDILRRGARNLSEAGFMPNNVAAAISHYGEGHISLREGLDAVSLQQHISDGKNDALEDLFESVEQELRDESGEAAEFSYDTKLTFPAELALGKIYDEARKQLPDEYSVTERRVKTDWLDKITSPVPDKKHLRRRRERIEEEHKETLMRVSEAEEFTDLVIGLLVEGDMRDAIQDQEYEDFETNTPLRGPEVAGIAQETLFEELQPRLDEYPEGVRRAYERAVDLGMGHQDEDDEFRRMFEEARENPGDAEDIIEPYREGETESRFSLDWSEVELPFFASQYERVGVLYDGMFEMYKEAGLDVDDDFKRSMVLSTIGAQIWLDDVDDLEEDWQNGQLTPVTAEVTSSDGEEAYENIVSMKDRYLEAAREYALRSESHLASIGIEYIDRRGQDLNLQGQIESIKDERT